MKKNDTKNRLRESLMSKIKEAESNETPQKDKPNDFDKEYSEVQRKLQNTMLKMNQVMAAAGLGDPKNATDRSLFGKKVHKEKNEEGGTYLFSQEELASVSKVIDNPSVYLSTTKKK